jgi:hypothetical protein
VNEQNAGEGGGGGRGRTATTTKPPRPASDIPAVAPLNRKI